MLVQEIEIDADLRLTDITSSFLMSSSSLHPLVPGNMNPVFRTENVRDTGLSRIVGNNHLKLNLAEDETTRFGMDGIAFQLGQFYPFISAGSLRHLLYHRRKHVQWQDYHSTECEGH